MTPPTITFTTYGKINGDGPAFYCDCRENGKSMLLFSAGTADDAERIARAWADKNLLTPERLERMAQRAAERSERMVKRKAREKV